jgi:putative transposase
MARPPRIPVWLGWDQRVIYFITFCVAGRHKVLANDATWTAFQEARNNLQHWEIIAAILMPDHIHLLAAPNDRDTAVGNIAAAIKRRIRRRLEAQWQWRQPGCFDRLLRYDESADEKWAYIRENPVRAGLVNDWRDWPYRFPCEL